MTEPVRSVLHDAQVAQGATFRDDDGWLWTMGFGDPAAGYAAIRDGVSMWDVYPLVKWDVTGPQAAAAIQRVFTRDVGAQAIGQVCYGAFVDDDGRLVDDGTVFKHADDHFWVLTNTSGFGEFWSERTGGLDFQHVNRVHDMPLVSVQGPRSRELLSTLTDDGLSDLRYFHFRTDPVTVGGVPTWLMRTGFSGELGFELIPPRDGAVDLWTRLGEAGAVPIGLDALEPARIEAGLIIYGTDYTPGEHTPYDVSMDRVVGLGSDAPIPARAALEKIAAAPPRRLKTLVMAGDELPDAGADVRSRGSVVGVLSSRVASPRHGDIGLAMLASNVALDGADLTVDAPDGGRVAATVAPLSIKDPRRLRPRA
jgi:aminomethyltransferase